MSTIFYQAASFKLAPPSTLVVCNSPYLGDMQVVRVVL
jgi:hypothetical protein